MEYDIFREELAIKYPSQGHALWVPSSGGLYPAVEVGDVGFIREGRFHRLFNVLLPKDHPSHENFGVPEHYEPLELRMMKHIYPGTISPIDFRSREVTVVSGELGVYAAGPEPAQVTFSCSRKRGAILSLPVHAQRSDTLARGEFAKCILKHIDIWFTFARDLGLGVTRMEDIILVTGRDLARSWTNVAFSESKEGEQVSLGVRVTSGGDVEWQFSREDIRGVAVNCGPSGQNLPQNQCIFIRGFRVTRFLKILPRLRGAAEPTQGPRGDESEFEMKIISTPSDTDYQDPLHTLLDYLTTQAPNCDVALVHDDDLRYIDVASLGNLQPAAVLGHLRKSRPEIRQFQSDVFPAIKGGSEAEIRVAEVATLSKYEFEAPPDNLGSVNTRGLVDSRLGLRGENSEITRGTDTMLSNWTNMRVDAGTSSGAKGDSVTKDSGVLANTHTGRESSGSNRGTGIQSLFNTSSIRNERVRLRSPASPSISPPLLPVHRSLPAPSPHRHYWTSSTFAPTLVTSQPSRQPSPSTLRYLSSPPVSTPPSPTASLVGNPATGMQAPPE